MDWKQWSPKAHSYEPPDWTEESVYAIRAVYAGTANADQQKTAMRWIEYVAGVGEFADLSFRPGGQGGDRETTFAEGKRFVGLQILKALHPSITEAIEQERAREAAPNTKRGAR